jgi:hypothetical protein
MEYVYYHCKNHQTDETKYHAHINNQEDLINIIERNYITYIVACSCLFNVDAIAKLNKNASVEMEGILNKWIDCRNHNYFCNNKRFYVQNSVLYGTELETGRIRSITRISTEQFLNQIKIGSIISRDTEESINYVKKILEGTTFLLREISALLPNGSTGRVYVVDSFHNNIKPALKQ